MRLLLAGMLLVSASSIAQGSPDADLPVTRATEARGPVTGTGTVGTPAEEEASLDAEVVANLELLEELPALEQLALLEALGRPEDRER